MTDTRRRLLRFVNAGVMTVLVGALCAIRGAQTWMAYTACLLSGMLLGPLWGGLAAGIGSAAYEAIAGSGVFTILITLASHFTMGFFCGMMMEKDKEKRRYYQTLDAGLVGAVLGMTLQLVLSTILTSIEERINWVTLALAFPTPLVHAGIAVLMAAMIYQAVRTWKKWDLALAAKTAALAAVVCLLCWVGKDHAFFAYAACLGGSMVLGALPGGLASGVGFAVYDVITGAEPAAILISFLARFTLGFVCGLLMEEYKDRMKYGRMLESAVVGALTGVWMYLMLTVVVYDVINQSTWAASFADVPRMLLDLAIAVAVVPIFCLIASAPKKKWSLMTIVFAGVMAAMVYVVTLFRFPLGGSKVHFANAVCLLAGMLLGPVPGGVAAGLGSALYDAFYGYDLLNVLITFVSKFAMALVCGLVMNAFRKRKPEPKVYQTVIAAAAGALTYVALYMVKTYVYGLIAGNAWASVAAKFPASIINAGVAIVAAPLFYHAVMPALKASGILRKLRQSEEPEPAQVVEAAEPVQVSENAEPVQVMEVAEPAQVSENAELTQASENTEQIQSEAAEPAQASENAEQAASRNDPE